VSEKINSIFFLYVLNKSRSFIGAEFYILKFIYYIRDILI